MKRREYAQVPVLQESGAGPSPCRQEQLQFAGKSLSAGLPIYARNQVKAIAAILERG